MKKKDFTLFTLVAVLMTATFVGCSKDEYEQDYNPLIDNPEPEQPNNPPNPGGQDSYNETYRPQIHYTPAQNWMNDPNVMVFSDGTYHLF